MQQFDAWKRFEQQHSGAQAHLFCAIFGTAKAEPRYKTENDFFNEFKTQDTRADLQIL